MNFDAVVFLFISPLPLLLLLVLTFLSLFISRVTSKENFLAIGFGGVALGYVSVLAVALVTSVIAVMGNFSLGYLVGMFLILAYLACLFVAVIVLPWAVFLRRYSVGWLIVGSGVIGTILLEALSYSITSRDFGSGTTPQLIGDFFSVIMLTFFISVSAAFLLGIRIRSRSVSL